MSALFDFHSLIIVILLFICSCTYLKMRIPNFLVNGNGFRGILWKAARIGERKSWAVSLFLLGMGISTFFS